MYENNVINWEEIFNLYNTVKWMYALAEEVDPELNTNLQPLNEFRSALDHLMRIVAIEKLDDYKDRDANEEAKALKGHLKRAFYDMADMLSIHYRKKINNKLEEYTSDEISRAIPTYYSEILPTIESSMANDIASLRTDKRFEKDNEGDESFCDDYIALIMQLNEFYKTVINAIPSLAELQRKNKSEKRQKRWTQWIIPIAAIVIGGVIAIAGWFFT